MTAVGGPAPAVGPVDRAAGPVVGGDQAAAPQSRLRYAANLRRPNSV